MSDTLLDLSGKVDQLSLQLYDSLTQVATSCGIQFYVVGARARDMILVHGYGREITRATMDINLGIRVSNWDEFNKLRDTLLQSKDFTPTKEIQRLLYMEELPVDILPFGIIEQGDRNISWPPDHSIVMNVLGFEEAWKAALMVRIRSEPPLYIRCATLAGLVVMKLAAWAGRGSERKRDAPDLAYIMHHYMDAGNCERVLDEHLDLTQVEDFDYVRAGIRLLGRDMAEILDQNAKAKIIEILEKETQDDGEYQLVQAMMASGDLTRESFTEHLKNLEELKTGIHES